MQYPNAPIREAVFDIKIDSINTINYEDLLRIKEFIIGEFPIEDTKRNFIIEFPISGQPMQGSPQNNIVGYVYKSKDESRQIQIRFDGFTLNILKPYENWETHFECFIKYWEHYNNLFKPNKITRIATRYINRDRKSTRLN